MSQVTFAFTDNPTSEELQTLATLAHEWAGNHNGPIGLWFDGVIKGQPLTIEPSYHRPSGSASTKTSSKRPMSQATRNKISRALRERHAQRTGS